MSTYPLPSNVGEPNFDNLLTVLRREVPPRPIFFELFLNVRLHNALTAYETSPASPYHHQHKLMAAFRNAGYDYATMIMPNFAFPSAHEKHGQTISLRNGN